MDEKLYAIRAEEIIGRTLLVKAKNLEEALEKMQDAITSDKLILDPVEDFCDRNIMPSTRFKDGLVPEGVDVSYYEKLENYINKGETDDSIKLSPN